MLLVKQMDQLTPPESELVTVTRQIIFFHQGVEQGKVIFRPAQCHVWLH